MTNLTEKECNTLLADNYIGQLAYIYNNRPFVVPITYYFDGKNTIISYSAEGHKTMAMRKINKVSMQVSDIKNINNWNSILAHGFFKEITGSDAKKYLHEFATRVKDLILRKEEKNLHTIGDFSSKTNTDALPIVFKITTYELTGKSRAK